MSVRRAQIEPLAFAAAVILVVLAHMVIGEMVPKNISLATSERAALMLVPTLDSFVRATGPVIRGFNALSNGVLRLAGVTPQDELKSALTLASRTAADVVIPTDRLVTVTPATTAAEIEALTARTGYSRFPVRAGNGLLGFVHIKDVLLSAPDPSQPWTAGHLHAMPAIAADTPLPDALTALRRGRSHIWARPQGQRDRRSSRPGRRRRPVRGRDLRCRPPLSNAEGIP